MTVLVCSVRAGSRTEQQQCENSRTGNQCSAGMPSTEIGVGELILGAMLVVV